MNKILYFQKLEDRYIFYFCFFRITIKKRHLLTGRARDRYDIAVLKKELGNIKKNINNIHLHTHQELIIELFLYNMYLKNKDTKCNIDHIIENSKSVSISCWGPNPGCIYDNLPYIFSTDGYKITCHPDNTYTDCYCMHGTRPFTGNITIIQKAIYSGNPLFIVELGFIANVESWAGIKNPTEYNQTISYVIDDLAPYYDARRVNRLELMLNDPSHVISDSERQRAARVIDVIIKNHLSKYNHQPIFSPCIGREGVKKVLVIDQVCKDMAVIKGGINEQTFADMLQAAIDENPDADIIVKTHPDVLKGLGGCYSYLKEEDNIYLYAQAINPISLINYVDKVYVGTSQYGFEALMCGKEVHVFGKPFYAGWGLTHDRQKISRRTHTRSLYELFYITYIQYTRYATPKTKKRCEIEEAIDYLIEMRAKYFKENNIRFAPLSD